MVVAISASPQMRYMILHCGRRDNLMFRQQESALHRSIASARPAAARHRSASSRRGVAARGVDGAAEEEGCSYRMRPQSFFLSFGPYVWFNTKRRNF